jgi:hypothetical protein
LVLLCVAALPSCAVFGGDRQAIVIPESPTVAVGASYDLGVAACNSELTLDTILLVALGAAFVTSYGRIDVLLAVPGALIPECNAIPFTIEETRWNTNDPPFTLERSEVNPDVFTVTALREGDAELTFVFDLEGEREEVTRRIEAVTIDRVEAAIGCEEGTVVAGGTTQPVLLRAWAGERELQSFGYGYVPYDVEGGELAVEDGDPHSGTITVPDTPGTVRLTSTADPSFDRSYRIVGADDWDGLEVVSDVEVGSDVPIEGNARLSAMASISGETLCSDDALKTMTSTTPDVCHLADDSVTVGMGSALVTFDAPGTCSVDVALDGTDLGETVSWEVAPGWPDHSPPESMAEIELRAMWATDGEVLVAGAEGAAGRLLRFDGSSWELMVSAAEHPPMSKVWASAADDLYGIDAGGAVWHYDGTTAEEISLGGDFQARDVWGSGPDDVWVVGFERSFTTTGTDAGTDGDASDAGDAGGEADASSDGGASSDAGTDAGIVPTDFTTGLHHYDGGDWVEVSIPLELGLFDARTPSELFGSGPGDLFLLSTTALTRYEGTTFTDRTPVVRGEPIASALDGYASSGGVWVTSSEGLYANDGTSWGVIGPAITGHRIRGGGGSVAVMSSTELWADDGTGWRSISRPYARPQVDIAVGAPTDLWVITDARLGRYAL